MTLEVDELIIENNLRMKIDIRCRSCCSCSGFSETVNSCFMNIENSDFEAPGAVRLEVDYSGLIEKLNCSR